MTADVIPLHPAARPDDRAALIAALPELHALITLDPLLGATPVRVYFVLNPAAQAEIVEAIGPLDRRAAAGTHAYALVAYDFPLALFQLKGETPSIPDERAKAIIRSSSALQGEGLVRAADALGLDATRIATFDAGALKRVFFPSTQEEVVDLLRIRIAA
jgi:hypothetical protein